MINFDSTLLHNNALLKLKFNQVAAPHSKFFIEVLSPNGKLNCFEMQADLYDHWQVIHPCEEWIVELQSQLSKMISSRLTD